MLSILILDDHLGFRKLLRMHILSKWPDAKIVESDPTTEGKGPQDYRGADYQLVLLDYQLGGLNGFDFLRHFRTLPEFPPVIMLTGEGSERIAVEAIKLGAADYIPKQQMTHEVLSRAMQEALDARGTVARLEQAAPAPISVPERDVHIKGLKLLRKLAEGGMSTIFLAERSGNAEQLALKVSDLEYGDEESVAIQRFTREYEILQRLRHRYIVKIYEQGFTDEYAYITMEYLEGGSLRRLADSTPGVDKAVEIALSIAEALEVVHQAGIVHRDIKPHNIMFRKDGSLALIDFGVARPLEEALDLTRVGEIIGTPHYISPEQIDGLIPDTRSDLYSLGVIFFELLTGCVPYAARTALAVMYKHKHAPIPALPEPLLRFQKIIERLLAKDPDDRYPAVAEFRTALQAAV